MSIDLNDFKEELSEEYNDTKFLIEQLDHEMNVILERRQAIMAKDINPLVVQMDEILNSLDPSGFNGDYLYKSNWYKNLDLESWGIYKQIDVGEKSGIDENTLLVDNLNNIKVGSELLIQIDNGEKVARTVKSISYSEYYEGYLITLDSDISTWERKYDSYIKYTKCSDPIEEKACVAYNPCSDDFYSPPEWEDDLPEYVESNTIPLKIKYGVAPYTWKIISGENDGWSLEYESTNDEYNTLYSNYTCDIPAIVQVTDYCGNNTDEYFVVNTLNFEISLSAPTTINQGDDYIVTVNGGSQPFNWEIKEQSSINDCSNDKCVTLQSNTTSGNSNIINTSNYACGSIIIRVKDKCGLTAQCETEIYDTFDYKTIYKVSYFNSYNDWRYSTHLYPEEGFEKPFLIPIRCLISGHFSIKWLNQPKLREISDKLYNSYYNPINENPTAKWSAFPECGALPNEENEQFEKDDITVSHESATNSYTNVGFKSDFSNGFYIDNNNYSVTQQSIGYVATSSSYLVNDDGSLCGWDEWQYPWDRPHECYVQSYCFNNFGGYNEVFANRSYYYHINERPVMSALAAIRLYSWNNNYMIYNIGYYPFYTNCENHLKNYAYEEWTGYIRNYKRAVRSLNSYTSDNIIIKKKICKTSNYIWEVENFGDDPELIYIQTF